jgi:hypothetical protein
MTRKSFLGRFVDSSLKSFRQERIVHALEYKLEERAAEQLVLVGPGIEAFLDNLRGVNRHQLPSAFRHVFVAALKKFASVAALLCFSTQAHAAPGWSAAFTIQSFIPTDTGLKLVVSGNDNLVGCSSPTWISLNRTDPNFDLISSALLTAFVQGKAAKVWESYCDTDGSIHITAGWIDR